MSRFSELMNSIPLLLIVSTVAGAIAGWLAAVLMQRERRALQLLPLTPGRFRRAIALGMLILPLLWGALYVAERQWLSIDCVEVQPSPLGRELRYLFHALLLVLLVVAILIDFDCYSIPDAVTLPGTLLALGLAYSSQELQIMHIWVDWGYEIPGVQGPWLPEWMDRHRGWHALAWSFAGMAMGAGLTAIVRSVSQRILGQEALGMGDVTLNGMIGAFLGWQAIALSFFVAPLFGLLNASLTLALTGKTFVPYGPSLALGAVTVLSCWGNCWRTTRWLFGDPVAMGILAGLALLLLLVLLAIVRRIHPREHEADLAA